LEEEMKKVLSIFLVGMLLFSLAACSGQNSDAEKKAVLVVSFGSSFQENREAAIDATEASVAEAFPDYDLYRAFTSQIIIDIYADRDGVDIDNVTQAIERIYEEGYGEVLVVPTLVINGEEQEEMQEALEPFEEKFSKFTLSSPLLNSYEDYVALVNSMATELPTTAEGEAIVLMGHGTPHEGNSAYGTLDYIFKDEGYANVFVGTVEGFPTFDTILKNLEAGGYSKVTLLPAMIVAGDHAHNDMAGDEEDSWKQMLKAEGYDVDFVMAGLGELPSIRGQFVAHAQDALAQN
jgi:sirohydrochlorin cobaltochelatase